MPDIIQVAIVDDHKLFRTGIAALLKEFTDIHICLEAPNGMALQKLITEHNIPDVILMDINMPLMNGLETTIWLKKNYPTIQILTLTMLDDEESVIKMLKAGSGGYILKESEVQELNKAIHDMYTKGFYTNDLVSGRMIKAFHEKEEPGESLKLSEKELQFLQLCASELSYKEMADSLGIAVRSVDNYSRSLFEKTGAKTRVGLVLWAIKNKLIKAPYVILPHIFFLPWH
jgi:DNA-binding NarL/FixJ family response regulator